VRELLAAIVFLRRFGEDLDQDRRIRHRLAELREPCGGERRSRGVSEGVFTWLG
jgi:hypothetical protein